LALIDLYLCLFLTGVHMYRKAYSRVCTKQLYRGGQCRDNFSFLFVAWGMCDTNDTGWNCSLWVSNRK